MYRAVSGSRTHRREAPCAYPPDDVAVDVRRLVPEVVGSGLRGREVRGEPLALGLGVLLGLVGLVGRVEIFQGFLGRGRGAAPQIGVDEVFGGSSAARTSSPSAWKSSAETDGPSSTLSSMSTSGSSSSSSSGSASSSSAPTSAFASGTEAAGSCSSLSISPGSSGGGSGARGGTPIVGRESVSGATAYAGCTRPSVTSAARSFSTANASAGAAAEMSAAVDSPSIRRTTDSASSVRPNVANSSSKRASRTSGTSAPPR